MSSLSRPQSSAAMRSPITHAAGFSSPLKYSSNSFNPDSTAIFASEERKFFSSGKGSSRDLDRDASGRNRSGSYSTSSSAASPEYRTYRVHSPPPIPERMQNPAYNGRSQQQQLAAEIGRSSTAVPRSHRHPQQQHEATSPKGIYPSLPPLRSKTTSSSTLAPFSSYQEPAVEDPYPPHRYRSPVYSPPPSSAASTASASSPPTSQPVSPMRQLHPLAHGHAHAHAPHGRHHSLSTNVYATDYAGNNKLVPSGRPGASSKRHSQHSGYSSSGLGAVGPALSQNIPPVLPRPPSLKGTSSSTLGRSGSLRGNVPRKGDSKTVTDEEQAAYAALNTYR